MDTYTWDEGEYIQMLLSIEEDERQVERLIKQLYEGISFFKKGDQEGILHDCTKPGYKYQFSYFDQYGAIGDIQKNTLKEMAYSINVYGFYPCKKESLKIIK